MSFVKTLIDLQKECDVLNLKMTSLEIKIEEIPSLAEDAHKTMRGLF